ncbi:hypothetical protein GDO81_024011 [Engystomops pustulosus]|uniref:Uncharacterized protein n=1 Tax=Engystomops pustulosus TaxID=76066 RepID=A0AAV6ZHJ5_ENGPU|nr:hypothetical protein GDO81_024011 [Engystomops pustulosus]
MCDHIALELSLPEQNNDFPPRNREPPLSSDSHRCRSLVYGVYVSNVFLLLRQQRDLSSRICVHPNTWRLRLVSYRIKVIV